MGRTHYWFTTIPVEATEEGTDRWAIEQGYVSMTPLTLDLTEHQALERVRKLESWKKLRFA
jgi:5'-nucleotidase